VPSSWDRIYSAATGSSCDTLLDHAVIPTRLEVTGNLCIKGNLGDGQVDPKVTGPSVLVGGGVTLDVYSSIGSASSPIPTIAIAGGCQWGSQAMHSPCGTADRVYGTTISTNPVISGQPSIDWSGWYQNAMPGPKHPCTTSSGSPRPSTATAPTTAVSPSRTSRPWVELHVPGLEQRHVAGGASRAGTRRRTC
jgi:hypothetical protein